MDHFTHVRTKKFDIEKYTLKSPMSDMHYHNAHECYYILEGEREYFVGDKFFMIHKGDFIFIPKGFLHRTAGKGATRILIYFNNEFLETFFKEPLLKMLFPTEPFVYRPSEDDRKELETLLNTMLTTYTKEENSELDEESGMDIIIEELLHLFLMIKHKANTYIPQSFANRHIEAAILYISENYKQIKSIDEIAQKLFISKYHLCHLFTKYLGIPIMDYINMLKIKYACELIKSNEYSMMDICMKCGYNSAPYFSTIFKRLKGMTPKEYQKSLEL